MPSHLIEPQLPAALAGAAIRHGHRELLDTFRAFADSFDPGADRDPDPDALRAALTFLRHGVLPFATWEERCLEPASPLAEDTAFEHAFLHAEIDALGAEVERLLESGAVRGSAAHDTVRRRAARVGAILELHVLKAEDREESSIGGGHAVVVPSSAACSDPIAGDSELRQMSDAEIDGLLRSESWGLLATVEGDQPYSVPVSYGYDGRALYLACGPGRKVRNMEAHAKVCLTVAHVRDGNFWRTVVVQGEAMPLLGFVARAAALRLIHQQRAGTAAVTLAEARRVARARVYRISPTEVSGRIRG